MPVPDLQPFPVRPFLLEALEANPVGDNIRVTVDADELLQLLGDREQLRIVLGNLIRNAREAMAKGGELRLAARLTADNVEVTVTDTGTGIAPEHLSRITEPLYSTKARGLGLGLAIARAILDKNGGGLRVASELGKGSSFTVSLKGASSEQGQGSS